MDPRESCVNRTLLKVVGGTPNSASTREDLQALPQKGFSVAITGDPGAAWAVSLSLHSISYERLLFSRARGT